MLNSGSTLRNMSVALSMLATSFSLMAQAPQQPQVCPMGPMGEQTKVEQKQTAEKREVLSEHEAIAYYMGTDKRPCHFRTALCPDRCGHSQSVAKFKIVGYLNYDKKGQYGDEKQQMFFYSLNRTESGQPADPAIVEWVNKLKVGDLVKIKWNHEYVTNNGGSYPERPMLSLSVITPEKAAELLKAPVPAFEAEKPRDPAARPMPLPARMPR